MMTDGDNMENKKFICQKPELAAKSITAPNRCRRSDGNIVNATKQGNCDTHIFYWWYWSMR